MSTTHQIQSEVRRVIYASPPAPVSMTDYYYDIAGADHFWVQRRFDVFRHLADSLVRNANCIAEIGCGNGVVQRQIEEHYSLPVAGFDLNEFALKKNMSRLSPVYCYDIRHRSPEFQHKFDLVVCFDVLEHIDDESGFLQSIKHHLKPSGALVINVPAHQVLYSKYDEAAGHVRRYSTRSLSAALQKNGMSVRSFTYWGLPLVPLLALRKALVSLRKTEEGIYSTGFDPGSSAANSALRLLSRCEPLPQRFLGTSVMATAEIQS